MGRHTFAVPLALAALMFVAACASTNPPPARKTAVDTQLYQDILRRDAEQFARFNAHDVDGLMSLFTEDLEFYHDKDGLLSHAQVAAGFTKLFARNDGLRRDLVPGSVTVYPLGAYGALETGAHRFCHVEQGKEDCGVFQFAHVWRNTNGEWKVARVLSYGH